MKTLISFFTISIFLGNCTKKYNEKVTVSLPFKIEELSKNTIKKNDTLTIRGYIFNQDVINNTNISFNRVIGRILSVARDSVIVIVPETTSGILILRQHIYEASASYIYKP